MTCAPEFAFANVVCHTFGLATGPLIYILMQIREDFLYFAESYLHWEGTTRMCVTQVRALVFSSSHILTSKASLAN